MLYQCLTFNQNCSMEQNFNPRTQGFIEGTKKSFAEFKALKKSEGKICMKRDMPEIVDKSTGNVIPAHKALCFFVAKRDASGNILRGANGGPIAVPDTMEYVNFGPSVPESTPASELSARAEELEVGTLQSGNIVLYKPNYNGITGELVD